MRRSHNTPSVSDSDAWTAYRRRIRRRHARRRRRLWRAGYVATAVGALVVASALAARWSAPSSGWWPQVAAAALPLLGPLTLPAALGFGVAAARTRRFGAGVCAVALSALFAGWALRTSPPTQAGEQGQSFRVMTLNAGDAWGREGLVESYIVESEPDLILLQEAGVKGGPLAPAVARIMALAEYYVLVDSETSGEGAGRQVTLSRLPVISYTAGRLGSDEPEAGVYSRTVVRWDGTDVAVYNIHLRPFNPAVGWSWQRAMSPAVWAETPGNLRTVFGEQAAEADVLARLVAAETRPVIVAGDFNSTPDQWPRAVLARTLREAVGRWRPAATRPDRWPAVNVDGVLVSPELTVARAGVGPAGLSDHRALWVTLQLSPERPPATLSP